MLQLIDEAEIEMNEAVDGHMRILVTGATAAGLTIAFSLSPLIDYVNAIWFAQAGMALGVGAAFLLFALSRLG